MKYAYFWGSLFGAIVVLIIFLLKPKYRKEMLVVGILVGVYGVLSEYWFFRDYWRPELVLKIGALGGIEDFLFGFTAGGFSAVVYNFFSHPNTKEYPKRSWIYPITVLNVVLSFVIFHELMGINTIFASALGYLIQTTIMLVIRRDLLINVLVSALLMGICLTLAEGIMLIFIGPYLENYYLLHDKMPIILGIFPLTEFLWGVCFGSTIGPLFEFANGIGSRSLFEKKK